MGLALWVTSHTPHYVAVHRKGLDHAGLFEAMRGRPVRIVGEHPKVHVHDFEGREVAVRDFTPKSSAYRRPEAVFPILQRISSGRPALVEHAMAHYQVFSAAGSRQVIVTDWHAGSRTMREFLADSDVPAVQKRRACVVLMRKLARLHAQGSLHGHPKLDNAVASAQHVGLLVDPTRLVDGEPDLFDFDRESESTQLASNLATHLIHATPGESRLALQREFVSQYARSYARFVRFMARRD
ncbi:hypothetical protein HYV43_04785 [Candidatus Micrarchaeota archaeon]|nr:hypothetical protein [Candidatus Micrarchaeota archaeon]